MENGKKPAFYNPNSYLMQGDDGIGLTKREYFAGQALVGLMVQAIPGNHNINNSLVVKQAIDIADDLLAELEKPKTE